MNRFIILLVLISTILVTAQQYPEVTIMDIQYQHPDSLLLYGDRPSPLNGDTVTIVGVVMNNPYKGSNPDSGTVLIAGAPALYLQDTSETDFGGILVRYVGPTSAAFNTLDTGKIIKITGYIEEYNITTQFQVIEFDFSGILGQMQRPQPIVMPLDSLSLIGSGQGQILAEKWEGVLVEVRDVTVATNATIGEGSWSVTDANNTEVIIGNQSSYIRNSTPPAVGTVLEYTRGYIQNRDNVTGIPFANIICPVYFSDYKIGTYPPNISGVTRDPGIVGFGQPVTVSAEITDLDGTVSSAKLHYRKNSGSRVVVNMTNQGGNQWSVTIPAQNDSSLIDYYIWAQDNDGFTSTNPIDTVKNLYFYMVLNRPLTIQDIQYSPFGGGWSGYNNYSVTVSGIVTADTTDFTDTNHIPIANIFIQNGTGPWSGLQVFGTQALNVQKGDELTVTGTIQENFSVTRINLTDLQTTSTGNPVPAPTDITVSQIGTKFNGTVSAEQWEGVLVNFNDVTVKNENADGAPGPYIPSVNSNFGEIEITDPSNDSCRVELQDGDHSYHNFWSYSLQGLPIYVRTGHTFDQLQGIMSFSFSYYKLIPRTNSDFIGYNPVGVDDHNNLNPDEYSLSQNYPNPFNPSTSIAYSIPVEGLVTLKIFNILGQEVKTLVNEVKSAGTHKISFNAADLTSGVYFYSLKAGNYTEVKKMMLLK